MPEDIQNAWTVYWREDLRRLVLSLLIVISLLVVAVLVDRNFGLINFFSRWI